MNAPLTIALLFLAADAGAAVELPAARVTGAGRDTRDCVDDETAFATVISRASFGPRATTLADLLRDVAGVSLRAQGTGSLGYVSIRGSTTEQVEVFLDGVPMNRAIGGGVNIGDFPLANIERIEVYRGTAPARLGASSMGGAINIVTRGAAEKAVEASLSFGSLGTIGGALSTSHAVARWRIELAGSIERAQGDFQLRSDNGTPENPLDDFLTTRWNNGHTVANALARATADLPGRASLVLSNSLLWRTNGIPSDAPDSKTGATSQNRARFETIRDLSVAHLTKRDFIAKRLDLAVIAHLVVAHETYWDPTGLVGAGITDASADFPGAGASAEVAYALGDSQRLSLHLAYRYETASLVDPPHDTTADATRHTFRAGLADEIRIAKGRFLANPSVQLHVLRDHGSLVGPLLGAATPVAEREELSAKLGLLWKAAPFLTLRANAGRYFRPPNLTELFGNQGTLMGNPTLRAETGFNADIGFRVARPDAGSASWNAWFEAAYFRAVATDLIQFVRTSSVTAKAFNIAGADIRGVEIEAGAAVGPLSGRVAYTWARVVDESKTATHGLIIPSRPAHTLRTRGAFSRGRSTVFYEFLYVSGNYIDTNNRFLLDPREVHSVGAVTEIGKHVRFAIEMRNVTNNRTADVYGVPLPGITIASQLTMGF